MDEPNALWDRLIQENDAALAALAEQEAVLMAIAGYYGRELQIASDIFWDLRDGLEEMPGDRSEEPQRKRGKVYQHFDRVCMEYLVLSKKFAAVEKQLTLVRSAMKLRLAQQREMSPVEAS